MAKATNNKIESKDFAWQELTVPFDYDTYAANKAATKAILVTFSTNAQPGVGSTDDKTPDELWIDDMSLVYYSQLSSLTVKGASVTGFDKDTYDYNMTCEGEVTADDINVVATGRQAVVGKKVEKTHVYTVNIKTAAPAGINAAVNNTNAAPAAIYNAAGQRVNAAAKGLNIVKNNDGTVKKVMVK